MRSPGGGKVAGLTGTGFAAGRAAGFLALGAARRTGVFLAGFFAGFFAGFLRAAGRFAGAFLRLAFAFFLAAICDLPAGPRPTRTDYRSYMLIQPAAASNKSRDEIRVTRYR